MIGGSDLLASPTALTIIYDDGCEFCRRCRLWLERQPQLVSLAFVPASTPSVREWAGEWLPVGEELVVVGAVGAPGALSDRVDAVSGGQAVWVGPDAFLVCLWALRGYRNLSQWLQRAGLRSIARQVVHGLTVGRGPLSAMLAAAPPPPGTCSAGVITSG